MGQMIVRLFTHQSVTRTNQDPNLIRIKDRLRNATINGTSHIARGYSAIDHFDIAEIRSRIDLGMDFFLWRILILIKNQILHYCAYSLQAKLIFQRPASPGHEILIIHKFESTQTNANLLPYTLDNVLICYSLNYYEHHLINSRPNFWSKLYEHLIKFCF